MTDHIGIRFKIGDAFLADEPLARWLTACAMALNDLLLVNRWLIPKLQGDGPDYEHLYLARLAGSHLFEAAKFLEESDRRIPEVRQFVAGLDEEAQAGYERLMALGTRGASGLAQQLKRARDYFAHYAELLPDSPEHEALRAALLEHTGTTGEIYDEETPLEGFRARFADDIAVELSFPEESVDLEEFVPGVADHIGVFINFAMTALAHHITSLPREMWDHIEEGH